MSKDKKLFEKIMVSANEEYYVVIKGHKRGLCIVMVSFPEHTSSFLKSEKSKIWSSMFTMPSFREIYMITFDR